MSPERWRQIDEVFQKAADLPTSARFAFLEQACGEDKDLRLEVESLLGFDSEHTTELDDLIQSAAASVASDDPNAAVGQKIGPYRILKPIGRGGMGSVYLATRDDDTFQKKVALKVVKRGMDTDFILSRFLHERQILAGLQHPNIAQLLDGGATGDGLPYFVMEYVDGKPITEYSQRKNLPIRDQIGLMRQVCSAVTCAHQNLIVHRDLKPGNILVTEEGVPKLLDFGIAKILHDDFSTTAATRTLTGIRLMTPEYASPEQVKGEAITTATDVYALGVILYELFTGQAPYQLNSNGLAEVHRVICETDPPAPSTVDEGLRRKLQGDLDNIVLMAMKKEPARRYASVNQLSEDLRRHLEGLPVVARKDTVRYRVGKFVRRNRIPVAATVLLAVTLVAGAATTLWQARVAQRRFQQLRHLANAFLFDFHDSIATLPGSMKARSLVVTKGLEYLDALGQESRGDAELQAEIARAYSRLGDVQGNPLESNLGDSSGALKSYRRAVEILRQISPRTPQVKRDLISAYTKLGTIQRDMGSTTEGLGSYRRAVALASEILAVEPSRGVMKDLSVLHDYEGRTLTTMGDIEGSLKATSESLALLNTLRAADPMNAEFIDSAATNYGTMAVQLPRLNRLDEALASARKAVEIREKQVAQDPNNTRRQRMLMIALSHEGDNLGLPTRANLERYDEALAVNRRMLGIAQALADKDPHDKRLQLDVAFCLLRIGAVMSVKGPRAEARQTLLRALGILESLAANDPKNSAIQRNIVVVLDRLSRVEESEPAISHLAIAVAMSEAILKQDLKNQDVRAISFTAMRRYAEMLADAGNRAAAIEMAQKAITVANESATVAGTDFARAGYPAVAAFSRAVVHERLREPEEARKWFRLSEERWKELERQGKFTAFYRKERELTKKAISN